MGVTYVMSSVGRTQANPLAVDVGGLPFAESDGSRWRARVLVAASVLGAGARAGAGGSGGR
ncbi:hypothetical protein ASG94_17505 [Nocardioides sp. Soil805]|nr:hypothetical protein ASG94_17505 [Nocardioides sp. Soil805]